MIRGQAEAEKTDAGVEAAGTEVGGQAAKDTGEAEPGVVMPSVSVTESGGGGSGVVLPPVSVTSPHARPSLTTSTVNHDLHGPAVPAAAPTSPTVMPPLMLPKTSPMATARAAPPTTAIVLPSVASTDAASVYQHHEQTPANLCSQVRPSSCFH